MLNIKRDSLHRADEENTPNANRPQPKCDARWGPSGDTKNEVDFAAQKRAKRLARWSVNTNGN